MLQALTSVGGPEKVTFQLTSEGLAPQALFQLCYPFLGDEVGRSSVMGDFDDQRKTLYWGAMECC